jgi:ABC-2 type transport system ATP-binding protein
MSIGVEVEDLTARYGATVALDGVTLSIAAGGITGLLGRNGSGKTTLLSVLAAFRPASSGTVRVDGEDPWENARVMRQVALIRESGDVQNDIRLRDTLHLLQTARPTFDRAFADRLMETFELDPGKTPGKLSRGKKSAFGVVVGLATRAPLTLLDEVHLGMDAPSRYAFYDALVADYAEHPRTIVISSHLIEEVQRLLEHVVILDEGTVLLSDGAETLRGRGVSVTGPTEAVTRFVEGRNVIGRRQLGRTSQVTVYGELTATDAAAAHTAGLELGGVDLQDLFVDLTSKGVTVDPTTKEAVR